MKKDYDINDLYNAYKSLKIKKNDIIYITGNLLSLGRYENRNILNDNFNVLKNIIGKKGTIAFPTHSFELVSSKRVFDIKNTYSETGSFTEFLRKKKNSVRQNHPYSSTTAIGKYAKFICTNNTQHVYGPNSPFQRLIDLNAKFIGFGMSPGLTATQVHHAEFMMDVPYRFIKTFKQRSKINKKIVTKEFYLFVLHKNLIALRRDRNKKIFRYFVKKNKILRKKLGKSYIYSYSFSKFYKSTIELMKKDICCWLTSEARTKFQKSKLRE